MSKAEKFIREHTKTCSNIVRGYQVIDNGVPQAIHKEWLTLYEARKAVEIVREEMIEKACRGYCDDICEKGMCGMCFHKHDSKGQVKNTFKYNECYALQILINSMKDE